MGFYKGNCSIAGFLLYNSVMTQVFISYSRTDLDFVQRLAMDLQQAGLDVWWDLSDIQGSDVWERRIEEGLRTSQYFIVVLTPDSLESRWVRREYLSADNANIKIIPLKLKSYDVTPLTLRDIQPIDAIDRRYEDVLSDVLRTLKRSDVNREKEVAVLQKGLWDQIVELLLAKGTRGVDVGGTIPLVAFFLLAGFELLGPGEDAVNVLLGAVAVLAGIYLLIRKTIPETVLFRVLGIVYLLAYGVVNYLEFYYSGSSAVSIVAGVAAVLTGGVMLRAINQPKKPIYFASFSFTIYLFFIAAKMYSGYVENYDAGLEVPVMITSVATAILLWRDV